jgi:hypothetical protein
MDSRYIDHRYAPALSWTNIGRPDDVYKTLVRDDGALLYEWTKDVNEVFSEFRTTIEFRLCGAILPRSIQQRCDDPGNNVVITEIDYYHCLLTLVAFGHAHEGVRTDVVLWSIRAHPGATKFPAALQMVLGGMDSIPGVQARGNALSIAPEKSSIPISRAENRHILLTSPYPVAPSKYIDCPKDRFTHACFQTSSPESQLCEEGEMRGAVFIPQNHSCIDDFTYHWAQDALQQNRDFWRKSSEKSQTLRVPDESIQKTLDACVRNILQARVVKNDIHYFQVGAAVYRGLWLVDGHFILEAMRYLGHEEAKHQGITALLKMARPDGVIMNGAVHSVALHSKETGIALATFVRQCELSADWDELTKLWPTIKKAVSAIQAWREEANRLPASHPCRGLWPEGFGDGGLGGIRPEYTNVLWTLAGLRQAARGARMIGCQDDFQVFQNEFEDLLKVFVEHSKKNMAKTNDGIPYLPINIPNASSEHIFDPKFEGIIPIGEKLMPASATWALAHAIYPGEVFSPEERIVQNLLHLYDSLDDEEGIPKETGWLGEGSVWNYQASFSAHIWAYAGRWDKMVDYLYAFANHASSTYVWREEQSLRGLPYERWFGDMPHNWASAEFIRMVRHMLVFERGESLEILPGVPREWFKVQSPIFVNKTPTRFGYVTLRVDVDLSNNVTVHCKRESLGHLQPDSVLVHLPNGASTVCINDQPATLHHDCVLVTGETADIQFRL